MKRAYKKWYIERSPPNASSFHPNFDCCDITILSHTLTSNRNTGLNTRHGRVARWWVRARWCCRSFDVIPIRASSCFPKTQRRFSLRKDCVQFLYLCACTECFFFVLCTFVIEHFVLWILYVCYHFRCASSLWSVAYIYMYTIIVPARFSYTHSYDSQSLRIHSVPTSRQSFYCLLASRWRHRSRPWSTVCSHPNTDQRTGLCKYNCIIMAHTRFWCSTKQ